MAASDAAQPFRSPASVTKGEVCHPVDEGCRGLTEAVGNMSALSSMEPFEAFYRREFTSVVGLIYALFGTPAAEELAQEAFLEACLNWERIGALDNPGAWVRKVAWRMAGRSKRREALEAKVLAEKLFEASTDASLTELPAEQVEFWQVVRKLPPREVQCLVLHYQADCPVADIADILDISPNTVKSYLYYGRSHLAEQLGLDVKHGESHER
jgi:RNA polymerase sigma-70 factor (ECF subfamily)